MNILRSVAFLLIYTVSISCFAYDLYDSDYTTLSPQDEYLFELFCEANNNRYILGSDIFVELPKELKHRSTLQYKCENFGKKYSSGFRVLLQAIDLQQIYELRSDKNTPLNELKNELEKLNLNKNARDINNIKKLAELLELDHIFLNCQGGVLEISPEDKTKLIKMHDDIHRKKPETSIIKHIFVEVDKRVVLFSIIWNKEDISLTIHDSINRPINSDSPLYICTNYLIKFFIGK